MHLRGSGSIHSNPTVFCRFMDRSIQFGEDSTRDPKGHVGRPSLHLILCISAWPAPREALTPSKSWPLSAIRAAVSPRRLHPRLASGEQVPPLVRPPPAARLPLGRPLPAAARPTSAVARPPAACAGSARSRPLPGRPWIAGLRHLCTQPAGRSPGHQTRLPCLRM